MVENWLGDAITVLHEHDTLHHLAEHWHGQREFIRHSMQTLPFWLSMGGLAVAAYLWWYLHQRNPAIDKDLQQRGGWLTRVLEDKYGFDDFNQRVFAGGGQLLGRFLWKSSDQRFIDGAVVNGSAKAVGWLAGRVRHLQSGMLYHYAFAMILGLVLLLTLFVTF